MLSSRATRGVRRSMGRVGITREALEAGADHRFRIGRPSGERDEAAVHVEGRAGAWAAIVGGRGELDPGVVELEGLACQQLRHALGDQLVAMPFGLAQTLPAVAPVGLELLRVADAFEAGDVVEHCRACGRPCIVPDVFDLPLRFSPRTFGGWLSGGRTDETSTVNSRF